MGKEGRKESDVLYEKRMEVDIFILVHGPRQYPGLLLETTVERSAKGLDSSDQNYPIMFRY